MKKIIMVFALILSIVTFGEEKVRIVTGEWEPYTTEKMKDKGFVTEIVIAVFKEAGIEYQLEFMPWKRGETEVAKGYAFATFPYISTEERNKIFNFSDIVAETSFKIFYLKSKFTYHPKWETYADLKSYRIGGTLGYWYETPFKEAGLITDYAVSDEIGVKKLYSERVDVLAAGDLVGWQLIKNLYPKEIDKFDTMDKPLAVDGLRLMISRTYPNSAKIEMKFKEALKKIKQNGIHSAILKKYNMK